MSYYKEFLLKYEKKIIHIKYIDRFNSGSAIGVLLFSDKGFTIYNGGQINCFEGVKTCYDQLTDLENENDFIPYENVTHVSETVNGGESTEDYLQRLWHSKYINIKNMIAGDNVNSSVFSLSGPQPSQEDHSGMIYNPYTNTWSYF